MKRILLIAVALIATMTAMAQNIAVVNPSNVTKIYQTLEEAITNAAPGSTIYLPGGGFQIKDEIKINKKLTIMGVSHRADADNADGATVIAGNLFFEGESSGSAVLGVYISGNVNIGEEESSVNNVTIKKCNLNSIQVKNSTCSGTIVNQNYIRNCSSFNQTPATITNNIMHSLNGVNGGIVSNNIITSNYVYASGSTWRGSWTESCAIGASNSNLSSNIITNYRTTPHQGNDDQISNNMIGTNWGENTINVSGKDWNDIFENFNNGTISPASDFHFKGEYKQYENKVGIYAGTSFDPDALAPIPRIVSKNVAEQSDGSGKLKIEVKIKAK